MTSTTSVRRDTSEFRLCQTRGGIRFISLVLPCRDEPDSKRHQWESCECLLVDSAGLTKSLILEEMVGESQAVVSSEG